jgi:hypothetical protein
VVVAHTFNPRTWKEAEFEASLVYKVSSRTARATQRNPVLKNQNQNQKKKKKKNREEQNPYKTNHEKGFISFQNQCWGKQPCQVDLKRFTQI